MQPTVLIADDTQFMRFVLRELLHEIPLVRIAEAGTHDEAIHLNDELSPDMAIIDTTSEDFNGFELIREIASGERAPSVVAITEIDDLAAERAAMAAGAEAIIIRPYDPDVVLATMDDLLTICVPG